MLLKRRKFNINSDNKNKVEPNHYHALEMPSQLINCVGEKTKYGELLDSFIREDLPESILSENDVDQELLKKFIVQSLPKSDDVIIRSLKKE